MVVVQDNGKGFDPVTVNPERNGMTNLRLRMSELGGNCTVDSQPGRGCRVEFNVPLRRPRSGLWWGLGFPRSLAPGPDKASTR